MDTNPPACAQKGDMMQKMETNAEKAEPGVMIARHAARTAIRFAEQAADEINVRLRDAEQERDNFARKLGVQQDVVDRLRAEREYRTRHVREMLAACDVITRAP